MMRVSTFPRKCSGIHAALVAAVLALGAGSTAGVASPGPDEETHIYTNARVANFVAAERLDGGHEAVTLSFWSGPHATTIEYDSGEDAGIVRLRPLGRTADGKGFRARTPDGSIWTVTFSGDALLLDDGTGPRPRLFLWQYQGPVEGRGTACVPCVPEAEALPFVQGAFMHGEPSPRGY